MPIYTSQNVLCLSRNKMAYTWIYTQLSNLNKTLQIAVLYMSELEMHGAW